MEREFKKVVFIKGLEGIMNFARHEEDVRQKFFEIRISTLDGDEFTISDDFGKDLRVGQRLEIIIQKDTGD